MTNAATVVLLEDAVEIIDRATAGVANKLKQLLIEAVAPNSNPRPRR